MNKKVLLDIIESVKNTPNSHFNMSVWKKSNCKTSGCAIGSYLMDHPRCKLKLKLYDEETDERDRPVKIFQPVMGNLEQFHAVAAYCDIEVASATYLFDPGQYFNVSTITKKMVIDRITDFIANNPDNEYKKFEKNNAKVYIENARDQIKSLQHGIRNNQITLAQIEREQRGECEG